MTLNPFHLWVTVCADSRPCCIPDKQPGLLGLNLTKWEETIWNSAQTRAEHWTRNLGAIEETTLLTFTLSCPWTFLLKSSWKCAMQKISCCQPNLKSFSIIYCVFLGDGNSSDNSGCTCWNKLAKDLTALEVEVQNGEGGYNAFSALRMDSGLVWCRAYNHSFVLTLSDSFWIICVIPYHFLCAGL